MEPVYNDAGIQTILELIWIHKDISVCGNPGIKSYQYWEIFKSLKNNRDPGDLCIPADSLYDFDRKAYSRLNW